MSNRKEADSSPPGPAYGSPARKPTQGVGSSPLSRKAQPLNIVGELLADLERANEDFLASKNGELAILNDLLKAKGEIRELSEALDELEVLHEDETIKSAELDVLLEAEKTETARLAALLETEKTETARLDALLEAEKAKSAMFWYSLTCFLMIMCVFLHASGRSTHAPVPPSMSTALAVVPLAFPLTGVFLTPKVCAPPPVRSISQASGGVFFTAARVSLTNFTCPANHTPANHTPVVLDTPMCPANHTPVVLDTPMCPANHTPVVFDNPVCPANHTPANHTSATVALLAPSEQYPELSDDHAEPVPPTAHMRAPAPLQQSGPLSYDWQGLLIGCGLAWRAAVSFTVFGLFMAAAAEPLHMHTRGKTYWFYHLFASQ